MQFAGRIPRKCSTRFMFVYRGGVHIVTQDVRRSRNVITSHRIIWLVLPVDAELLRALARREGCSYIVRVKA